MAWYAFDCSRNKTDIAGLRGFCRSTTMVLLGLTPGHHCVIEATPDQETERDESML